MWGLPTPPQPPWGLRGKRLYRKRASEDPNRDKANSDNRSLVIGPEPDSRADTKAEPILIRKLSLGKGECPPQAHIFSMQSGV